MFSLVCQHQGFLFPGCYFRWWFWQLWYVKCSLPEILKIVTRLLVIRDSEFLPCVDGFEDESLGELDEDDKEDEDDDDSYSSFCPSWIFLLRWFHSFLGYWLWDLVFGAIALPVVWASSLWLELELIPPLWFPGVSLKFLAYHRPLFLW